MGGEGERGVVVGGEGESLGVGGEGERGVVVGGEGVVIHQGLG